MSTDTFDALIVGAGPAGLTAAIYLARYRRTVLVMDGGPSRAAWIPRSHNTPGFPQGVTGEALLTRLREQADAFGVTRRQGLVERLNAGTGGFIADGPVGQVSARSVVLATGVADRIPPVAGIAEAIRDSVVRMCPICDAYEAIDRRLAILSDGPLGQREAEFLGRYSDDVTILQVGGPDGAAIPHGTHRIDLDQLEIFGGRVTLLDAPGIAPFDHLYLALGCAPQNALALSLGAESDAAGALVVDAHQRTTVARVYAAGDLVRGLNQVAVATGEAAIAATALHNDLRALQT